VVVVGYQVVEVGEHLVHGHRLLDGVQAECRHALQGHGRHQAQRSQPDPGGVEDVGVLGARAFQDRAVRRDQPQADDLCRQVAVAQAGPVGGGLGGAGDGLPVDVAQVLERQSPAVELVGQPVQGDPGLDGHPVVGSIVAEHAGVAPEVDEDAVGAGDGGERVPGADGLDPLPVGRRLLDQIDQLTLGRRPPDLGRGARLVAPPVRPVGAGDGGGGRHGRPA
jgi:hypothetical protein